MRIGFKGSLALGLFLLWMTARAAFCAMAVPDGLNAAQTDFNRGRADDALRTLDAELHRNTANAAAWNLQCRIYLAQGRFEDAIASCRRSAQLVPGGSDYHLWLGRAYGEKASHASLVAAYQTAKLVRSEFETAVSLDGSNREALSDLGQYYVEAPRILGGGTSKAEAIAARLRPLDPARADELRARIAEAKKDYAGAEQSWRAKITASQSSTDTAAQAWMDLGSFYRRRGRWDEMTAALKSGAAADANRGPALVDGASTLIQAGRESKLAEQWLREYLGGKALSDAAPAFAVHAELGALLRKQGDAAAADREFAAARALSAAYSSEATLSVGD